MADHGVVGDYDAPAGDAVLHHRAPVEDVPITGHRHNEGLWGFVRLRGGTRDGEVVLTPLDVDFYVWDDEHYELGKISTEGAQ